VPVTYVPPYELYSRPAAYQDAATHPGPIVSWVASKCTTQSNRIALAQAFLDAGLLASYGRCLNNGPLPSTASQLHAADVEAFPHYFQSGRQDTFSKLAAHRGHPFALVTENTIASGYVTEKVFHALAAGVLPIYLGTADIDYYVPQGSIIKASDFGGDYASLVAHVRAIAADPAAYKKFHAWRLSGGDGERARPVLDHLSSPSTAACRLCWAVHSRRSVAVIIPERDRDYAHRPVAFHLHAGLIAHGVLHSIHVVRQAGGLPFNRGRLLNVGVLITDGAHQKQGADASRSRVCFNDIDAVPIGHLTQPSMAWKHYLLPDRAAAVGTDAGFGAVIACMPRNMLREINGWSSQLWGWGVEDRNFHARVMHHPSSFLGVCGVNATNECTGPSEMAYKRQLHFRLLAHGTEMESRKRDPLRNDLQMRDCLWRRNEQLHLKQTGAHFEPRGTRANMHHKHPDASSAVHFPLLDDGLSTCSFTLLSSQRMLGAGFMLHTVDFLDHEARRAVLQCQRRADK